MAAQHKDWTREGQSLACHRILAFNLYCKIPFGQIHMHNPRGNVAQASRRRVKAACLAAKFGNTRRDGAPTRSRDGCATLPAISSRGGNVFLKRS